MRRTSDRPRNDRGSALLELLLAALVVAILFSLSAPRYFAAMNRMHRQTAVLDEAIGRSTELGGGDPGAGTGNLDFRCPAELDDTGAGAQPSDPATTLSAICDLFKSLTVPETPPAP